MVRMAINGLGRMGKLVLRNLIDTSAGGDAVLVNNRLARRKTMLRSISFMALWVIFYDATQNNVPRLPGFAVRPLSEIVLLAATWSGFLTLVPFAVAATCFERRPLTRPVVMLPRFPFFGSRLHFLC